MEEIIAEEWKPTSGYPDYMISNFGRVRSLKGRKERILSPRKNRKGYISYVLANDNGLPVEVKCHHLVLNAFKETRPLGYQANHVNGIKHDNRPENLEWVTPKENTNHAYRIGLKKNHHGMETRLNISRGEKRWYENNHPWNYGKTLPESMKIKCSENNRHRKLHPGEVWLIKKLIFHQIDKLLISKMFNVSRDNICIIGAGKSWKHINYEGSPCNSL
jgi:hypothetical protein